jgi:hypothetical protein
LSGGAKFLILGKQMNTVTLLIRKTVSFPPLLVLCIFLLSCTKGAHPPVSFYFWKQRFALTKEQNAKLQACGTKRLYVKFFDVVLNENQEAMPISKIEFEQSSSMEIVPCVFVQNEVFNATKNTAKLAENIAKLVVSISKKQHLKWNELQLDCDWTSKTKVNYFAFLEALQTQLGKIRLSCTIRLHQIKYQESSGVPPVKKGLLMCYNMDDIDKVTTPNSIVSSQVFGQYVNENTSYPLQLDLALPIFQWGLIFRLGKLSMISNELTKAALDRSFVREVGNHIFQIKKDTVVNETNFCKGDIVRLETSSVKELYRLANQLSQTNLKFEQVIYYHLSQAHLNTYHAHHLSAISRLIP